MIEGGLRAAEVGFLQHCICCPTCVARKLGTPASAEVECVPGPPSTAYNSRPPAGRATLYHCELRVVLSLQPLVHCAARHPRVHNSPPTPLERRPRYLLHRS